VEFLVPRKRPLLYPDSNDVDPIEVRFTPISPTKNRNIDFLRGCIDAGAPKTMCGKRAAQALCDKLGIRFGLLPSFNRLNLLLNFVHLWDKYTYLCRIQLGQDLTGRNCGY
jgi:hypothetical protein